MEQGKHVEILKKMMKQAKENQKVCVTILPNLAGQPQRWVASPNKDGGVDLDFDCVENITSDKTPQ